MSDTQDRRHPDGLLTYEEAASWLGTSPRHVRKLVEMRELASIKVGSLVRIHPDDIEAYVNRQRRDAVVREHVLKAKAGLHAAGLRQRQRQVAERAQ